MKKYLLAFLLLQVSPLFSADTTSTGTVTLTIIDQASRDTKKTWGTKVNDNTQAIASYLTNQQNQINSLNTSTGSLLTLIQSTAVQVSNYITANNISTTSLSLNGGNTNYIQISTPTQPGAVMNIGSGTIANLTGITSTHTTVNITAGLGMAGINYTVPPADGSSGQALTTNGLKVLTWTTISGGGGSSGPSSSTLRGLTASGDMYLSTTPGQNSSHYVDYVSTFNISKLWAEISIPSTYTTCSSSFTLLASTGSNQGGVIISSALQNTPLFSMDYSVQRSTMIMVFDPPLRIVTGRHLFMSQSSDPTVCGPPPRGEWGLKPWGFFDP